MEPVKAHSSPTAYRRQRQIEQCLYENLLHTPYQSISVADLCRQVGISRKAYYNYYHDKDSCLCAIIDHMLRECTSRLTGLPDQASTAEAAAVLLGYWKEQKPFFDILIRNNLVYFMQMETFYYILNEDQSLLDLLDSPDVRSDSDILACYISSYITLLLQWYFRSFDTPVEEMAEKLVRILRGTGNPVQPS